MRLAARREIVLPILASQGEAMLTHTCMLATTLSNRHFPYDSEWKNPPKKTAGRLIYFNNQSARRSEQ
jgi:hypothetical protein